MSRLSPAQHSLNSVESWPKIPFIHSFIHSFIIILRDNVSDVYYVSRTKQLVVEVIRCQRGGDSLPLVLDTPCTPQEEANHQALVRDRERNKTRSHNAKLTRQTSILADMAGKLESIKKKIHANLGQLERVGLVNRHDHYQALLNSIVQVNGR